MNVRCRTYNCTVAAPRRRALAVPTGPSWELLREPEQTPGSGIDFVRLNFAELQSLGVIYLLA
jgi:hypothetical protein